MIGWVREWVLPLIGGTLLVFIGIAVFTGLLITRNLCADDVVSEQASPDGNTVAVVMERSCGATTPFVFHVNLRAATHKFSRHWSGTITDGQVFGVPRVAVRADWIGNDQLQVTCKDVSRVRNRTASWQHVRILYSDGLSTVPTNKGK